jgi:hypothetical protein
MNVATVTGSDISRSTLTAWRAVFGASLREATARASAPAEHGTLLMARVLIQGDVDRALVVICPMKEARRLAAGFFQKDAEALEATLVADVFGELANMIGGLIKRQLPRSSRLSLPDILPPEKEPPARSTLAEAIFDCGQAPMAVRLVQTPS